MTKEWKMWGLIKLKERNSPKFFVKASAALHTHANKMQIKTSPFFASRLYPSITSCDNETNVKTHWGCTFFSYYSLKLMLCASFQVYPITFVQQPFYLEAAINCSHLISDPLKCLFLPPSHYFCLANSRHRVSSKILRYASIAFLTPFI